MYGSETEWQHAQEQMDAADRRWAKSVENNGEWRYGQQAALFPCYECGEPADSTCDDCGKSFCREHGQLEGDRNGMAYPALCNKCRGL